MFVPGTRPSIFSTGRRSSSSRGSLWERETERKRICLVLLGLGLFTPLLCIYIFKAWGRGSGGLLEEGVQSMADLYSVWALAPSAHLGLRPAKENLHGTYGGPEFEAHVTVLGGFAVASQEEAVAKLQDLARSLDPITYRITGVGHRDTYFQCVFLTVDPTPQVVEANAQAKKIFDVAESESSAYFPHLSLLYGNVTDEDKKRAKASTEEKFGDFLLDSEFIVPSLSLWLTDTEDKLLTTWKKIAEYRLERSSN